jgi:uncharacterized protein (DUF2249 family)
VSAATIRVDVRDTEPRLRFDRIMGAYEGLRPGESMELAVDHDPTCMYYTLKGTRGDAAFAFEYLERGPESWRVRVTKRMDDAVGS